MNPDDMIDADLIDMPIHENPTHPTAQWHAKRYRCPLCKMESDYTYHSLKECVLKLAERIDNIERSADPRSRE